MNSKATLLFLASWMLIRSELRAVAQVQQAWVARYSGTAIPSYDHAFALAVDGVGNIYVTGDASFAGGTGGFATIKYDPNGTQRWVARYNGGVAEALAVDNAGNVYVAGQTSEDYTVVKYNSAGSQQWAARYNGPANLEDHPTALKVDNAGYVYVTGYSASAGDRNDYATVKYNASGVRLWVARYDGPWNYDDRASALAVDGAGNVYVTGFSYASDTGSDYATVKYGPNGNQLWVARYSGPGRYTGQGTAEDAASAIAVDNMGNVYVSGTSRGENGPEYTTVKYSASGVQLWVARYHGPIGLSSSASALAVDSAGNVHVTGVSDAPGSRYDYATIKYDTDGHQLWVARYNSSSWYSDAPNALALDGTGNVYVTGWSGLGQGVSPDYATVKYDPNGNQIWVARYNGPGSGYDEARAVAVDGAGNVFVTGYSAGTGEGFDYATVKYVQTVVSNVGGSVTSAVANLTMFYPGPLDRWLERPSPVQNQVGLKAVIYANRLFVAVGDYGTILTSANAVNWSLHHDGLPFPSLLQSIGWGNNLFVAVGSRGGIATSIDGANWTPRNTGTLSDLYSVAYGNGTFVAVGGYYDSTILTSNDTVNWTNRNAGDALTFRAVTYGNGRFVAVGYARVDLPGRVLTSMDGITWSIEGNLEPTMTLYGIGFGIDRFVSVGSVYLGSTAGYRGLAAVWAATDSSQVLQNSSSLSAVAYGGGTFLAVGSDGVILSSTDGYSWKGWHSGTSTYLTGVAYGNGTFVVVTSRGTILQSGYTPVILSGRSFSKGSGFEVTARGGIDGMHRFQATSSLALGDWTDLGTYSVTYTNPQAFTQFLDTNAPNSQQRFYRAVSP